MFQLLVNTLWYGAAFVSFLWLESSRIGIHLCLIQGKTAESTLSVKISTSCPYILYLEWYSNVFCKLYVKSCLIVLTVYGNKQIKKRILDAASADSGTTCSWPENAAPHI
jgi:hypothetical protein